MSILIKGMEMPTSCEDCPCAYFTEGVHHDYCQAVGYDSEIKRDSGWKLDDCPLVPVPPHGDLIDADKLVELCDIMADKCDGIGASIWHQFKTTVEWSPIVIPESEEGE